MLLHHMQMRDFTANSGINEKIFSQILRITENKDHSKFIVLVITEWLRNTKSEQFSDTLQLLRLSIKNKRSGKPTSDVIMAHIFRDLFGNTKWEAFKLLPTSNDLSLGAYHKLAH